MQLGQGGEVDSIAEIQHKQLTLFSLELGIPGEKRRLVEEAGKSRIYTYAYVLIELK